MRRFFALLLAAAMLCAATALAEATFDFDVDDFVFTYNTLAEGETFEAFGKDAKLRQTPVAQDEERGIYIYTSADQRTMVEFRCAPSGKCVSVEVVSDLTEKSNARNMPAWIAVMSVGVRWVSEDGFAQLIGDYDDACGGDAGGPTIWESEGFLCEVYKVNNAYEVFKMTKIAD